MPKDEGGGETDYARENNRDKKRLKTTKASNAGRHEVLLAKISNSKLEVKIIIMKKHI